MEFDYDHPIFTTSFHGVVVQGLSEEDLNAPRGTRVTFVVEVDSQRVPVVGDLAEKRGLPDKLWRPGRVVDMGGLPIGHVREFAVRSRDAGGLEVDFPYYPATSK